jgi:hypothetical protein
MTSHAPLLVPLHLGICESFKSGWFRELFLRLVSTTMLTGNSDSGA